MNCRDRALADQALARITRIRQLTELICGPKPPLEVPRYREPIAKPVRPIGKTITKSSNV